MRRILGHLAALCLFAAPAAAQECMQITTHYDLCPDGTPWAGAEIEQFGDGAAFHVGDLTMDYLEPYPGRGTGTLADDLAALNAFFAVTPEMVLMSDTVETEEMTAITQVRENDVADDRVARGIAEISGNRILITVSGPEETEPSRLHDALIEVLGTLSPRCTDGC